MARLARWAVPAVAAGLFAASLLLTSVSGDSQSLALVQGHLVDSTGAPLANQTVVIEGKKQVAKWSWFPFGPKIEKATSTVAVTDDAGVVQVVDLPAGDYTVKLLWIGSQKVPATKFTLEPNYTNVKFDGKFPVAGQSQPNVITPEQPGAPTSRFQIDMFKGQQHVPTAGESTTNSVPAK